MPKLIETNGVEVKMYFKDHAPPHVHAYYGEEEVLLVIPTGEVHEGSMTTSKLEIAQAYVKANADALLARWTQYGGAQ